MMSKDRFVQVFEHEKLRVTKEGVFKEHHLEQLIRFNEKNRNRYFKVIHNGIQCTQYVGVIQVDGLTIEILPKTDRSNQADTKKWQQVLLQMLSICNGMRVETSTKAHLKKKHNSVLQVYIDVYLTELEKLIRLGLIKKYSRVQRNQPALKGKLLVSAHIRKNLIKKELLYCEHTVYDKNHILHRILLKGLNIIEHLIPAKERNRIRNIQFYFQGVRDLPISTSSIKQLQLHRKSQSYSNALELAKMFIFRYVPDLNYGKDRLFALLFDMNTLWEEYIFRILQRYKPDGYKVSFQNVKRFWEYKTIRPDIVIRDGQNNNFIIDTKWKMNAFKNPSDQDLKQIFTYNLLWGAEKSLLIYPNEHKEVNTFEGKYHYLPAEFENHSCQQVLVSIVNNHMQLESESISKVIWSLITKNN